MNFIIYKFMQQEFIIYNLRFVNFHLSIILSLNTNGIEIYFFLILIILFFFVLFCTLFCFKETSRSFFLEIKIFQSFYHSSK